MIPESDHNVDGQAMIAGFFLALAVSLIPVIAAIFCTVLSPKEISLRRRSKALAKALLEFKGDQHS